MFRERWSETKKKARLDCSTVDDLAACLKRNGIAELSLGWHDSDFLRSRRALAVIEKAMKHNASVHTVSIGWRHRNRDLLIKLLEILAKHPQQLQHLRLILDDWVPEDVLVSLFTHQTSLRSINFTAVHVRPTGAPPPALVATEQCLISRLLVKHLHHHEHLKVLNLTDCDLTSAALVSLADFVHIRGGISELVLRSNRKLGVKGLTMICQSPVMKRLDLSLCDLGVEEAVAIADSVANRPWPLGELTVSGNIRMQTTGLLALVQQSTCNKLQHLNLGYCDFKEFQVVQILQTLATHHHPNSSSLLQRMTMLGCSVTSTDACEALCALLRQSSSSLRSVALHDPNDPNRMLQAPQMRLIKAAVEQNYELEELVVDPFSRSCAESINLWREIAFLLKLNRTGRRVLLNKQRPRRYTGFPVERPDDWFQVVEKSAADDDLSLSYWILRRSTDHFTANRIQPA